MQSNYIDDSIPVSHTASDDTVGDGRGDNEGKCDSTVDASRVREEHSSDAERTGSTCTIDSTCSTEKQNKDDKTCQSASTSIPSGNHGDEKSSPIDSNCTECCMHHPDPTPVQLMMYLHALSYQGEGWAYKTSLPEWADSDWRQ